MSPRGSRPASTKQTEPWRNRIVGHGDEVPDQLLANPKNWRIHPKGQQDALAGVLAQVGWVQEVIVNRTTGHLLDGHLRVTLAMRREEPSIPVKYVELTEAEEALVLATLDPIAALAGADPAKLDELLREVESGDAAVQAMLAELAQRTGVIPSNDEFAAAMGGLPSGDKAPFQQMTFTLSDHQAARVKQAVKAAQAAGDFNSTGNENSNGNALARICEAYLD